MPLPSTERKTQPKEDKSKGKIVILTGFPYKLHLQATLEEKKKKNDGKKTKDGQKKKNLKERETNQRKGNILKMPKRNSVQKKKNRRSKCGMSHEKMTIVPAFFAMNFTRTPSVVRAGSNASKSSSGP